MPLNYPAVGGATAQAIADLSAEEVWTYLTRRLTSLAIPTDIVKFLGKGTGTEVPDNQSFFGIFSITEFEQAYVADEVQATLNTTGAFLTLGSRNIAVALPSGASRVRAIALALIHIANRTANAQNIDLLLNVEGTTIFNQNTVVSFAGAEGSAFASIVQDCTAQVTGSGTFSIEAQARISAAQNVTFTVEYLIFVQYKMS